MRKRPKTRLEEREELLDELSAHMVDMASATINARSAFRQRPQDAARILSELQRELVAWSSHIRRELHGEL